MKTLTRQSVKDTPVVGKQRSYNEVVEFLDMHWQVNSNDTSLTAIKKLDQAFGNIAAKLNTILVGGTNGKSLTIQFATQLLREEGLSVGSFYAPHILTYNERLLFNNESISNKTFTELGNDVINMTESLSIDANSFDILTMMAFLFFKQQGIDVAVLEVGTHPWEQAARICSPKIAAITRVTTNDENASTQAIEHLLAIVSPGSHVVSADQSKLNLQVMHDLVSKRGAHWSMPIRKLATLAYPFEQLHGRCAALAERMCHIYVNVCLNKDSIIVSGTLLSKQKGKRGRPSLDDKRKSELNPKKTIEQFWRETINQLPGRFQLLEKEKPSLLLDNASNLDAFKNLLLGIRLLHYQRSLKGLTLIIGCNNRDLDVTEFLKLLRYFFKKTSGQVVICPVSPLPGQHADESWDVEKITNDIKSMKIKAKACRSFKEAFEFAQKTVDERHGLLVITGSTALVSEYWKHKGIKKL